MLRKKVFLYVSFVKSVQFVCAIIVKELRHMHDHQSQEQLAEATELSIAQLESGKNFPNLTTISIICKFYNITLGEFFAPLDYPTKDN